MAEGIAISSEDICEIRNDGYYQQAKEILTRERNQGRFEGEAHATFKIAINLILNGKLSHEEIGKVCGLSDETLQRVIKKYL